MTKWHALFAFEVLMTVCAALVVVHIVHLVATAPGLHLMPMPDLARLCFPVGMARC